MAKDGDAGSNWGTLVPRFLLGLVFLYHGGQKLFGLFGASDDILEKMTAAIAGWGWPMPDVLARAAAVTEFFGGACLVLGLMTRFWAAGLTVVMFVAIWKAHWAQGFGLDKGGWEYAFVLGILSLSLVVQGGGAFSIDRMFFSRSAKPKPPAGK